MNGLTKGKSVMNEESKMYCPFTKMPSVKAGESIVRCKVICPHVIGYADIYFNPRFGWVINENAERFSFPVLFWKYFYEEGSIDE